jgi:aminoglycoside/choline kinase family phosphotransferase
LQTQKKVNTLDKQVEINIQALFYQLTGRQAESVCSLASSGSYRRYYRLENKEISVIGAYNHDAKENAAFISFTNCFHGAGLPVPRVLATDEANYIYLLQDLGDITLFSWLSEKRYHNEFPVEITDMYKKAIGFLPMFQVKASALLDYSLCYPRAHFDKQSMLWDLSYFKYYFLKLVRINFDEQKLEDDFQTFSDFLLQTNTNYFLYRDFQSRNIMLKNGQPYFIDYQGGRKGALQYDIASLLYDAKADIPQENRNQLLDFYLDCLQLYADINRKEFTEYYYGYVFIRIMQALGAYGFRGFYEKKEHFLQSIPYALDNLTWLLNNVELPVKIPVMLNVLRDITKSEFLRQIAKQEIKLKVFVNSFSYKYDIPPDPSGNGGGFVFDCRGLQNPGKFDEYKSLNGNDKAVIDFMQKEPAIYEYMNHVYGLVDKTIETYLERKFTNLQVNFGCTGGQHRSVFCANLLTQHLKTNPNIETVVHHTMLEKIN